MFRKRNELNKSFVKLLIQNEYDPFAVAKNNQSIYRNTVNYNFKRFSLIEKFDVTGDGIGENYDIINLRLLHDDNILCAETYESDCQCLALIDISTLRFHHQQNACRSSSKRKLKASYVFELKPDFNEYIIYQPSRCDEIVVSTLYESLEYSYIDLSVLRKQNYEAVVNNKTISCVKGFFNTLGLCYPDFILLANLNDIVLSDISVSSINYHLSLPNDICICVGNDIDGKNFLIGTLSGNIFVLDNRSKNIGKTMNSYCSSTREMVVNINCLTQSENLFLVTYHNDEIYLVDKRNVNKCVFMFEPPTLSISSIVLNVIPNVEESSKIISRYAGPYQSFWSLQNGKLLANAVVGDSSSPAFNYINDFTLSLRQHRNKAFLFGCNDRSIDVYQNDDT